MSNPSLSVNITFPDDFKTTNKVIIYVHSTEGSTSFDLLLKDSSNKSINDLWDEIRSLSADDFLKDCFNATLE
jgi:hypothetical protein